MSNSLVNITIFHCYIFQDTYIKKTSSSNHNTYDKAFEIKKKRQRPIYFSLTF